MAKSRTALTIALGTAFAASLAAAPALGAPDNPFKMAPLKNGYQVADNDKAKEGKCGGDKAKEGKCGGDKAKEGKCGGDKAKEGKCGGTRPRKAPAAGTNRRSIVQPVSPIGIHGAGLGLRRELLAALKAGVPPAIRFLELAPENWIDVGGASGKSLRQFTERYPVVCHGLSLSLGGPAPLDEVFLSRVRKFMRTHGMTLYTEHLSYTTDDGQLYDLLPVPFTADAVQHVARRIRRTQEILEARIAIENASFYVAAPFAEMSELEFINAVLQEADCWLHLDVNNTYVNSVNFRYDPVAFMRGLPAQRVVYMHVAGHSREAQDLAIDTHGEDVIEPVWALLESAYEIFEVRPTLLERDCNIPGLDRLTAEIERIVSIQQQQSPALHARRA